MKQLANLVLVLTLGGLAACTTQPDTVQFTLGPTTAPTGAVQLVDGRPADAKSARGSTGNAEPKWFYGDDQFTPDRMSLLRQKMEGRLATAGVPKSAVVTRFEIINYYAKTDAANRRAANNPGMMFGAVGAIVGEIMSEVMRPSVEPQDQILCEIQGSVDGKPFVANFARAYVRSGGAGTNQYDDPAVRTTMETVIDICTQMAAESAATATVAQR